MKTNMGDVDRIIRLIFAAIILTLYFMGVVTGGLGLVLLIVAITFILTSAFGFCLFYAAFGISSCADKNCKF